MGIYSTFTLVGAPYYGEATYLSFLILYIQQKIIKYVLKKSYFRCGFMYGELTDKETVARLEYSLENQQQDQFEILLYKKNSKFSLKTLKFKQKK